MNDACSLAWESSYHVRSTANTYSKYMHAQGAYDGILQETCTEAVFVTGTNGRQERTCARMCRNSSYYSYESPVEDILPHTHWPALLLVVLLPTTYLLRCYGRAWHGSISTVGTLVWG